MKLRDCRFSVVRFAVLTLVALSGVAGHGGSAAEKSSETVFTKDGALKVTLPPRWFAKRTNPHFELLLATRDAKSLGMVHRLPERIPPEATLEWVDSVTVGSLFKRVTQVKDRGLRRFNAHGLPCLAHEFVAVQQGRRMVSLVVTTRVAGGVYQLNLDSRAELENERRPAMLAIAGSLAPGS